MPDIIAKMQEFNRVLDRHNKAEAFYNDESVSETDKEKFTEEYMKLFKHLESLHNEITELGYTFKVKDLEYGIGRW